MTAGVIMKKKLDFGQVFRRGWEIFKKNIGMLLLVILVGAAIVLAFITPGILAFIIAIGGSLTENQVHLNNFSIAGFIIFGLAVVLGIIASLIYSLALIKAIGNADAGKKIDLKEVYKFAWEKLWVFFWTQLLAGLFVMLGFIFFIIPGIIIAIYLQFVIFAIVFENKKGMDAIRRSWEMVKGNWWMVFLVLLVVGFAQGALSWIPVIGAIAGFILTPLWQCIIYSMYRQLASSK